MIKIKYFIFSLVCVFSCCNVFATNEISIESITPVYDEESTVIVTNENDNHSISFNNKDQNVKYNIVIKNNTDDELIINNINLNNPSEDFITYELEGIKKDDILKEAETKELSLTIKTTEINNLEEDFIEDIVASINFQKQIENPYTDTKDILIILIIATLITSGTIILCRKNKITRYIVFIIGFASIIPMAKALDTIDLEIKINVKYICKKWSDDGELKILSLGNSFSVDTLQYVYQIAENLGVEKITLGNLYISGCNLATHLNNAKNDSESYTYYTNTTGTWKTTSKYKISTAVESENWDYITFQQGSRTSGLADTYNDLEELVSIVHEMSPESKKVWHMTWAFQQNSTHSGFANYDNNQLTMYNAIVNSVKSKVLTNKRIVSVIPVGTSIQNARTSTLGDTLTRDGFHLSTGVGRYIGSLTFVSKLTKLDISKVTFAPSGIDENTKSIAITSSINAINNPYTITSFPQE